MEHLQHKGKATFFCLVSKSSYIKETDKIMAGYKKDTMYIIQNNIYITGSNETRKN